MFCDFSFLDVKLEQLYQKDEKTFQLMGYFAGLAILLACMGLLAVADIEHFRKIKAKVAPKLLMATR